MGMIEELHRALVRALEVDDAAGGVYPADLRADVEGALGTLERYYAPAPGGDGDGAVAAPAPAAPAARASVVKDGGGGFRVVARDEENAGYARTIGDLLNLLQGRQIGGLSALLVEVAIRVEALELQVQAFGEAQR